jgi:AraC-like DNA-binding protein
MHPSSNLVRSTLVKHLIEVLEQNEIDVASILTHHQLSEVQLKKGGFMLPFSKFCQIIEDGVSQSRLEHLGLICGSQYTMFDSSALTYLMLFAQDLKQAFYSLVQYWPLDGPYQGKLHLGDMSYFEFFNDARYSDIANRYHAEEIFICMYQIGQGGYRTNNLCRQVCFTFPEPENIALYQDMFNCDVLFNQPYNRLYFSENAIDWTLATSNPELFAVAKKQCDEQLSAIQNQHKTTGDIYRILSTSGMNQPSIEKVAKQFFVSTATLRRRLSAEHTTYKEIVKTFRINQACRYLKSTELSIEQIALNTGYSSTANFCRAFKTELKVTPMAYRDTSLEKR